MRDALPCRLITEESHRYEGLAALLRGWSPEVRLVSPALAMHERAIETTIDIFALDAPGSMQLARQLIQRRKPTGSPVLAIFQRGRPKPASLALALGCDDGLAFPMDEDELRLRLDLAGSLGALLHEQELRARVFGRPRDEVAASDPLIALVGYASSAHVKIADALPPRGVLLLPGIAALRERLQRAPPRLALLTTDKALSGSERDVAEVGRQAQAVGCGMLLGAPAGMVAIGHARAMGFADRIASDDSPEELRLRLQFWLKVAALRASLLAPLDGPDAWTGIDTEARLFGPGMLLDYLQTREAFPAGRARPLAVVQMDDLRESAKHLGESATRQVLAAIGRRLRGLVRAQDMVARLSEAAFCVAPSPAPKPQIEPLAQRLATGLAEPLVLADGREILLRPSVTVEIIRQPAEAEQALEKIQRTAPADRPRG